MSLNLSSLLGGGLIIKRQVITASGNWHRPERMAGDIVWLTMIGGGASGQFISPNGLGGWGGQFIIRIPVDIGSDTVVACTIGAGGANAANGAASNPGSPTSFGAYVTMLGGALSGDGAAGGSGGAGGGASAGSDTPLGYGGKPLSITSAVAGGGGGLILDPSGIGTAVLAGQATRSTGYGAGGGAASGTPFGRAGAPGAILVEWPEFI